MHPLTDIDGYRIYSCAWILCKQFLSPELPDDRTSRSRRSERGCLQSNTNLYFACCIKHQLQNQPSLAGARRIIALLLMQCSENREPLEELCQVWLCVYVFGRFPFGNSPRGWWNWGRLWFQRSDPLSSDGVELLGTIGNAAFHARHIHRLESTLQAFQDIQ